MTFTLHRRAFLSSASAMCFAAVTASAKLPNIPTIAATWVPLLGGAKVALEIALELFNAYVDVQNEMQQTQFTEATLSSIDIKLGAISDGVERIESEIAELKHAFLGDITGAFLSDKISKLRSRWGVYRVALNGKQTLDEISSSHARDEAVKQLTDLKTDIVKLVEEIKEGNSQNPIIVTPIFSAYSLLQAINARLIEDRGIFTDKEKLRAEWSAALQEQFGKWLDSLKDGKAPHSLASRKRELEAALPRAKTSVASFAQFDSDFQREIVNWKICGRTEGTGIVSGLNAERRASCLIAKARDAGWFGFSKMKFVLMDTQVKLSSAKACANEFFPAELFDLSIAHASLATATMDFDDEVWNDPVRQFPGHAVCDIQFVENIEQLEKLEKAGTLGSARPSPVVEFQKVVRSSNNLQAQMVALLSAWEFVKKQATMAEEGKFIIGVTYQRDPATNWPFALPDRPFTTR